MSAGSMPRLERIAPNPAGGVDELFVLREDAAAQSPDGLSQAPALSPAAVPAARLRIFHLNDMHNHLYDEAP
ncbi:MAG TPA: hypothetical protein ENK83_05795, partial [Aliiroseovarius sp.]|nr:hypothetical protein [Aliiroseovarius sp.]